ncbi:MAG: tetratricopeptide repeat protein [Actinomycetota bacterium]|nr:tetratricopeptide repeat protein [Actinomycetota bacterium]
MSRPRRPRRPPRARAPARTPSHKPKHEPVHLSADIVEELHATARPGKAEILVQTFSEAAGAFAASDFEEATRLGEQAKHLALRSVAARELLGLTHYRAGRYQEAALELAAFRRLSGSQEQNPVLADCHRALGRPQHSLEVCDEIVRPAVSEAVFYEGAIVAAGALADLGRMDEAIARLESLELEPAIAQEHHIRAWYALGDLLERRGRFRQALELFEAAAEADENATDAEERAQHLRNAT